MHHFQLLFCILKITETKREHSFGVIVFSERSRHSRLHVSFLLIERHEQSTRACVRPGRVDLNRKVNFNDIIPLMNCFYGANLENMATATESCSSHYHLKKIVN